MTILETRAAPSTAGTRSEPELLLDQLDGIDRWIGRHQTTDLRLAAATSRETRLDLARRADVVGRERQALMDWTAHQLRESGHVLQAVALRRAVIAHRHEWFKGKVSGGLQAGGVSVVACLENGADAIGVVVAEQPDLLLVEHRLPMVTGLDVTRAVRRYAPHTVIVVQAGDDWEIGPLLDAGATTVYPRRVPPADIVADLCALLAL